MGSDEDVREPPERVICGKRFDLAHVEGRSGEMARLQGGG